MSELNDVIIESEKRKKIYIHNVYGFKLTVHTYILLGF